jgi:hypothetical protein
MMPSHSSPQGGSRLGASILLSVVLILGTGPAALAHHTTGHSGGPPSTGDNLITEDNDGDGVANTPDPLGDADNRHPSGKDKHAESGGSGNQGKASSEPDGNGSGPERDAGGVDQPGQAGGLDVLDQDGNNGCGNDDDFEDDNEGWCGKDVTGQPTLQTEPPGTTEVGGGGTTVSSGVAAAVLGASENAPGSPSGAVLAAGQPRGAAGELAFTGLEVWPLGGVSLGLFVTGIVLIALGRRRA